MELTRDYARLGEENRNILSVPQFPCKFVGWVQTILSIQNYNKTIMAIDLTVIFLQ